MLIAQMAIGTFCTLTSFWIGTWVGANNDVCNHICLFTKEKFYIKLCWRFGYKLEHPVEIEST